VVDKKATKKNKNTNDAIKSLLFLAAARKISAIFVFDYRVFELPFVTKRLKTRLKKVEERRKQPRGGGGGALFAMSPDGLLLIKRFCFRVFFLSLLLVTQRPKTR
jgi:hypothetical protein